MSYDNITIEGAEADLSGSLVILALVAVLFLVAAILVILTFRSNKRKGYDTGIKEIGPIFFGAAGIAACFVGAWLGFVLADVTTQVAKQQEAALVEQLGFVSADVEGSVLRSFSPFSAEYPDGTFFVGRLETHDDNTFILVPNS